jgi:hypothetical protein
MPKKRRKLHRKNLKRTKRKNSQSIITITFNIIIIINRKKLSSNEKFTIKHKRKISNFYLRTFKKQQQLNKPNKLLHKTPAKMRSRRQKPAANNFFFSFNRKTNSNLLYAFFN